MDAPADELAALELAISALDSAAGGDRRGAGRPPRRQDRRRPRRRPISRVRAAEAAFAAGRPVRAAAYLDADDRRRGRPPRPDPARPASTTGSASSGGSPATPRARSPRDDGPSTSCRPAPVAGPRRRSSPGSPSCACSRARSPRPSGSPATRSGSPGRAIRRPAGWELHATTTLGVSLGWRADPEAAVAMLTEARAMAEELGDLDELFRVYANLTTVLDLAGRHEEAVDGRVARASPRRAAAGLEAVYGNVLRGNAADSLFLLGRWEEARAMSMTALEWLPAGVNFLNTLVVAGDRRDRAVRGRGGRPAARPDAARARGRPRRPAGRAAPPRVRVVRAVARRPRRRAPRRRARLGARPRDRGLDPRRADGRRPRSRSRRRRRSRRASSATWPSLAAARERAREVVRVGRGDRRAPRRRPVARARGGSPMRGWRRRAPTGDGSTAATTRRRGRAVGDAWAALEIPYETARARWREAEARLGSGAGRAGRADARAPLLEAVELALAPRRDAAPARAARAGRPGADHAAARGRASGSPGPTIGAREPVGVVAGPAVAAGGRHRTDGEPSGARASASPASREAPTGATRSGSAAASARCSCQIARGRTNREIGERLFISQKTVGVHVGNILVEARRVRPRRGGGRRDPPRAHRAGLGRSGHKSETRREVSGSRMRTFTGQQCPASE